ncbi:sensor domain-containing diguanylate cyclase [Paludibacterium paludis]|nr:sensor domain-containing diguanylate cyclase [Paludibacterium paludis]
MRSVYLASGLLWLVLTVLTGLSFASRAVSEAQTEFTRISQQLFENIGQKLQVNEAVLDSYATFTGLGMKNGGQEERQFVRQFLQRYPQIIAVMRIERVPLASRDSFLKEARARHGMMYTIHGLDKDGKGAAGSVALSEEGFPVTFIEPSNRISSRWLGADIATNDFLRDTLLDAIESGRSAASRSFDWADGRAAYLMVRPSDDLSTYVSAGGMPWHFVGMMVRTGSLSSQVGDLPPGMAVRLWHKRFSPSAPQGWFVNVAEPPSGWLESRIFPRLERVRQVGSEAQPLILSVSWQLGWKQIGLFEWGMSAALSLVTMVLLWLGCESYRRYLSSRVEREARLFYLANHDRLTGLANRGLFYDRLQHAISRLNRSGKRLAVLFLDLDRFKPVNDTYGHVVGDRILQMIATRMKQALRSEDTVARLGGDEFVVLLEDIESYREVDRVVARLKGSIEEIFEVEEHRIRVGVSIGVAYYPEDGVLIEELLSVADRKMYGDKREPEAVC